MLKILQVIMISSLVLSLGSAAPLMIEEKQQFIERIKTKDIAVIFYGHQDTEQYQSFEQLIPSYDQLFEGLQFLYVPANKFKLNRNHPSLSIYRKIGGGDWQHYHGGFNKEQMERWIRHQTTDPLKDLNIEQLQQLLKSGQSGFILLSYGQFELLRTKIYVNDFCVFKQIKCWKVQPTNPIYSVVTHLFGVGKQDFGISKLAFYSSATGRMHLYTGDVWTVKRQQLLEMFEGRKGIVQSESGEGEIKIQLHYQQAELHDL